MTTVTFHHGAQDKLLAACLLAQARFREGRKVLVYVPDPNLAAQFDQRLWTFSSLSFVPHCRAGNPHTGETPVVIAADTGLPGFDDVLLNLAPEAPPAFERYREVLEVVSKDEADVQPARQRFRHYRERGLEPRAESCP